MECSHCHQEVSDAEINLTEIYGPLCKKCLEEISEQESEHYRNP